MLPVSDFRFVKKKTHFHLIGVIKVKVLLSFFILAFILFLTQLVFANSLATDGQKLSKIAGEIQDFEEQNTNLKVEIAKISSFSFLSQKAQELGFAKPQQIIYP